MEYKLQLSLQQRAALKYAIQFWENKTIQDKVVEFIESSDDWGEFSKTVIEELNSNELPQKLEVELIHVIKMIGERILGWYYHIKDTYEARKEAINCIDKIHWTSYGTVDVVQIFESTSLDNPSFNITRLYKFACNHVMVDYINDLWNKIPSNLQDSYNRNTMNYFDKHLLVYWKCCRDEDLSNLMRYLEVTGDHYGDQYLHSFNYIYDLDRSTEVNMLRLSAHQGHFLAVKYFWETLTEEERDKNVLKCARIAVLGCQYYGNQSLMTNYLINQYVEIHIFLMNQMTESQKKAFFNKQLKMSKLYIGYNFELDVRDEILKMLLSGWPWQELFLVVFQDMIQLLDDDSMMTCEFLDSITNRMMQDYNLSFPIEMSYYRKILRGAWLIIPGTIKRKITEKYRKHNFIHNLLGMRDLDSLKLILHDPEIVDVKDWYIGFGSYSFEQLVVHDEYEILEQFIREMFKSEEEEKRFKRKIEPWFTFIIEDNFHLADKFLDWAYSVPEERQSAKNRIDYKDIGGFIIYKNNFKLFDKFLDWMCITEEEKKNCKDHFKNKELIISHIYRIWTDYKKHPKLAKDLSSEYLNWLLGPEEKAELFKKDMFVDLTITPIIVFYFAELERENMMKDLLIWFLTPDEEIQRIEQIVAQRSRRL